MMMVCRLLFHGLLMRMRQNSRKTGVVGLLV